MYQKLDFKFFLNDRDTCCCLSGSARATQLATLVPPPYHKSAFKMAQTTPKRRHFESWVVPDLSLLARAMEKCAKGMLFHRPSCKLHLAQPLTLVFSFLSSCADVELRVHTKTTVGDGLTPPLL